MEIKNAWKAYHGDRRLVIASIAAALFLLNVSVCRELLSLNYSIRVISGEAAFISMSRYIRDHWPDLSWWPIWYCGIPGENAYPPLLHTLGAAASACFHISAALAHHQLSALLYGFGPVGVFLLCIRLGARIFPAAVSALAYSLISPAPFIVPWVRLDLGGLFRPWRLYVLVGYGDAPHQFALALIPVAIISLDWAIRRREPFSALLTSALMASVLLTNWIGSVALGCAALGYTLATAKRDGLWRTLGLTLLIGIGAYAIASPWIPPRTMLLIFGNSEVIAGDYRSEMQSFPERLLLFVLLLVIAKWIMAKIRAPAALQFAVFFFVLPGSLPVIQALFNRSIIPQPHRYQLEMELGVCMILGLATGKLASLHRIAAIGTTAAVAFAAVAQYQAYRNYAAVLIRPIDITTTVEYETAAWIGQHMPGSRVFATGTPSYWLNAFSDNQQVNGAFEPATPNRLNADVTDFIRMGSGHPQTDAGLTLLWLQAFGADLAIVGGPETRAPFRRFNDSVRFSGMLTNVWRDRDDSIYLVPRKSRSLAHVLYPGDLVLRPPSNPSDVSDVQKYVRAIESSTLPAATFRWTSAHSVAVEAMVPKGALVSIQTGYVPGWRASANGKPAAITRDGLGFIVVDPRCSGPCSIRIWYGLTMERLFTAIACLAVLCAGAYFALSTAVRKLRRGLA